MMVDIFCPLCYEEKKQSCGNGRKSSCVAAIATDPSWYEEDFEKEKAFFERNMKWLTEMEIEDHLCPVCGYTFQADREDDNFHVYGYIGNGVYRR